MKDSQKNKKFNNHQKYNIASWFKIQKAKMLKAFVSLTLLSQKVFLPQVTNVTSFVNILPEKIDASVSTSKRAFSPIAFKSVFKSEFSIYTDPKNNYYFYKDLRCCCPDTVYLL